MNPQTDLLVDPGLFHTRVDRLDDRAAAMATRRRRLDRDVDALLGAWCGPAAAGFEEQYVAWRAAAALVTGDLAATVERLRCAGHALAACDAAVADCQRRLVTRLG